MDLAPSLPERSLSRRLEGCISAMLMEVFLFTRTEEKYAVERTLLSVIGPAFTVLPALGRGSRGGVEYDHAPRSRVAKWFSRPSLATFLPKAVYYVVAEEDEVDYLLDAIRGTLRSEGGPGDCGRGLAIVSPLESHCAISDAVDSSNRSGAVNMVPPAERCESNVS